MTLVIREWALGRWAVSELHWRETVVHEDLVVTVLADQPRLIGACSNMAIRGSTLRTRQKPFEGWMAARIQSSNAPSRRLYVN